MSLNEIMDVKVDVRWQKWLRAAFRQLMLQLILIFIALTVILPVLWIITIATDARGLAQYSELNIIPNPDRLSFNAFEDMIFEPFETLSSVNNEIYFTELLSNSLFVALGTAMLSVGLGASAAYAFSRFRFVGRQAGMLGFILLLMMPATGTIVPLIAIFSLLRIHVVFSTLAPSIFYGIIAALVALGLKSAVASIFKRPIFEERNLRWIPLAISLLFVFGIIYFAWGIMFRQSDAYDTAIRQPLRGFNVIEDEILDIQSNIPKADDNIVRQERRLDDAQKEVERAGEQFAAVDEQFPGIYTLADSLGRFSIIIGDASSGSQPSLLERIYAVTDLRAIAQAGLEAEVVNQAQRVADTKADRAQLDIDLENKRQEIDEARAPYIEMRNEALWDLLPYVFATFAVSLVLAGVAWFAFGLGRLKPGSLARRDRMGLTMLGGYLTIVVLIAYAWFTANYESPTKAAGLKDGGLWYDIRISFRSEDDIREDLEPYLERDDLEASLAELESTSLSEFREVRETEDTQLTDLINRLAAFDVTLDPPDNLTRREQIDWKDNRREEQKQGLRELQREANEYVGVTNRLNLLNNVNFKDELLAILRDRRAELEHELDLTNVSSSELAVANFNDAIDKLPGDADEHDRLTKELAVRSSNDGNVTETMKITLFGLVIAYSSSALPFAIWNLKGYFDTIPKELEEAALVDGANLISSFFRIILPLSLPALAITTLFSFMTGWTEFILAVQFLTAGDVDRTTLAMALRGIAGGGTTQAEPNYTNFAAMSILMAIPVVSLFYIFQRWIVSGLTVGGVKG